MTKKNAPSDWPSIRAERTKVNPNTGCIEWLGSRTRKGYGKVRMNRLWASVHRVAYEVEVGPIPEGMCVLHKCDNPACCNANHLYVGDNSTNIADKVAKCRAGKALTKDSVSSIKALLRVGVPQREIAALHGVNPCSISRIATGHRWRQVH